MRKAQRKRMEELGCPRLEPRKVLALSAEADDAIWHLASLARRRMLLGRGAEVGGRRGGGQVAAGAFPFGRSPSFNFRKCLFFISEL
ncbi:hypothetical protein SORBI_3001G415901 [Sorghum bicolor]|uniref:Uncharacterized protein n=1 Tax=Sorghum bicolor TaxID=4558 RepID=A0A1Z5SA37_SORBI|nr:hypothetical protein SORBI_3001G415901 [Sorghum bicolor]